MPKRADLANYTRWVLAEVPEQHEFAALDWLESPCQMQFITPFGRYFDTDLLEAVFAFTKPPPEFGASNENHLHFVVIVCGKIGRILGFSGLPGNIAWRTGVNKLPIGPVTFIGIILGEFSGVPFHVLLATTKHCNIEYALVNTTCLHCRARFVHRKTSQRQRLEL